MKFNSFLQPLVASLEESDCLGFRPKMALTKPSPEEMRAQKRRARLATGDPSAMREELQRKECELAQLNRVVDSVRQAVQERQEWLVASGTIKEVGALALALPASPGHMQAGGWAPTLSARGRAEMRTHHRVQAALEAAELAAASVRASLTSGPQATLTHEESDENFALEYGLLSPVGHCVESPVGAYGDHGLGDAPPRCTAGGGGGEDDDPYGEYGDAYGGGYGELYGSALPSPEAAGAAGAAPRRALSLAAPPTRALSHATTRYGRAQRSLSEAAAAEARPGQAGLPGQGGLPRAALVPGSHGGGASAEMVPAVQACHSYS